MCTYDHLITLETPAASREEAEFGVARSIHSGHKNRLELTDLPKTQQ